MSVMGQQNACKYCNKPVTELVMMIVSLMIIPILTLYMQVPDKV